MKALVLQDYGVMVVEDVPTPVPGAGEVLIEVVATGICGSDIHGFTGENGRRQLGQIMGHESVGRISRMGGGVQGLSLGQTVTFNPVVVPVGRLAEYAGREQHVPEKYVIGVRHDVSAAFAQYVCVPARNVIVLPDSMPPAFGALIEPLAVAVHATRRIDVAPSHAVLVVGGGPIGQSVVLALAMAGASRVIVSEVDPGRRELVESLGAMTIDPTSGPVRDHVIAEFGEPADRAIDAVGISATLADAAGATKQGGVIGLVGMGATSLTLDAYEVSTQERTIVGSFTYSDRDFADAAAWIASAPPQAARLISREVSLADAPAAFAELARGDGTPGKVLVRPGALDGISLNDAAAAH